MKQHLLYFLIIIVLFGLLPFFVSGNSSALGEISPLWGGQNLRIFYVDPKYEINGNREETALHLTGSSHTKIFVEKKYYGNLSAKNREIFLNSVSNLGVQFDSEIYPVVKKAFGGEWSPGIDNDPRITIYITEMKGNVDGYFRETDEFDVSRSNKREMIYINAKFIGQDKAPAILAHEFQHLINFNQKKRLRALEEEEWLDEALSEYAVTIAGFDNAGDYLHRTAKDFLANPTDSLGLWEEAFIDRASVSLFIHYFAGRYGEDILKDIIRSNFVGKEAINYALRKNGFDETFSDIFVDWTVALFLNSNIICHSEGAQATEESLLMARSFAGAQDERRCRSLYKFQHSELRYSELHVMPQLDYSVDNAGFNASFVVRDLAPEWHRFLPAKYNLQNPKFLQIIFESRGNYYFRVPVVVTYLSGDIEVLEVEIKNGAGILEIPNFNAKISSAVIIPASHTKLAGLFQSDPLRTFSYSARLVKEPKSLLSPVDFGNIVSVSGQPEVYVIKDSYRRHLQHPIFFDFYNHLKWENIKVMPPEVLNNYQESKLIRRAGDYKVYEVVGFNKIRWLDMTVEEFENSGRKWEQVYEINDAEFNWHQRI